ncbi:helix-turn-helix transcriptional regulator [Streptomyces sp. NPDC006129]|uniref:helix-turn-helix domain-containing protein n=1 Tax=Streptomyces sp. NPDC006129 TaxID=3155348 RepID=UPI00339FAE25
MPRPTPPDDRVVARRRQVGEQIRRVREHRNMTQQDVCGRSGIDVATYSRIEQGHSSPKLDTLIRIADAMRVELEDLVHRDAAAPDGGDEGGRDRGPATGVSGPGAGGALGQG